MLEIRPAWDPTDRVVVRLQPDRRELEVTTDIETLRYRLRDSRPDRLGWVEERSESGRGPVRQRVTVRDVVAACLREWDAEEQVIALTLAVARQARRRSAAWESASASLASQARQARRRHRVSPVALQVLWRHQSNPGRQDPMTATLAAARAGFHTKDGRADTQRFRRRLGVAHSTEHGERRVTRSIDYSSGVALCRALDVCPTDIGL